jgi:tetratricopeptide (TPR) repeat protein
MFKGRSESLWRTLVIVIVLDATGVGVLGKDVSVGDRVVILDAAGTASRMRAALTRDDRLPGLYSVLGTEGDMVLLTGGFDLRTERVNKTSVLEIHDADDHITEQIKRTPRTARLFLQRGWVRLELGDDDAASSDFEHALQLDRNLDAAYAALGAAKVKRGDLQGAVRTLEEGLKRNARSAELYVARANFWCVCDDFGQAVADLSRSIELEPKSGFLYAKRAFAWTKLGNDARALDDCNAAIRLKPGFGWAHQIRARVRTNTGDIGGALVDLNEATRLDKNDYESFANRANLELQCEQLDLAMKDCNEAMRISVASSALFALRAAISQARHDYPGAIADFDSAILLDPTNCLLHCMKGSAWRKLGNLDRAISEYTVGLGADPESTDAYFLRARTFRDKHEFRSALRDADRALELTRADGRPLLIRATVWAAMGRYGRALEDLEVATKMGSEVQRVAAAERSWIRSTCPDPKIRSGQLAIADARVVLQCPGQTAPMKKEAERVSALLTAVANAELGDFEAAIVWQRKAIAIYESEHRTTECNVHAAGRAWLDGLLRSMQERKPIRIAAAEVDYRIIEEVGQPVLRFSARTGVDGRVCLENPASKPR